MGQLTSRQEIINTEVSDPRMRNWLCANMAIRETSKVLSVCVHRNISQMHKNMQRTVGSSPPCNQNCSQKGASWCATCERWRKEILSISRPKYRSQINWSRLNSSQWPVNPYEVGRTFIPRAHRLFYKSAEFHEDYRFTLSFIENCCEIFIPRSLCEKAWQCRGQIKRKNNRMRLGSSELENTISVLVELLSQTVFGDTKEVIQKLESLVNEQENSGDGCLLM